MSEDHFVSYLHVLSVNAHQMKLETPWGSIHINKGFMEQIAITSAVIVLTVMLWRCTARFNATLKKKLRVGDESENAIDGDNETEDVNSSQDGNLILKGENSYHYTHQNPVAMTEGVVRTTVSSYGWSDSKKSVSIYLTDAAIKEMKINQLILKWTSMSLSLNLLDAPGGHTIKNLIISSLFHEITDATWTVSKDTLTITLIKALELPWNSLNGAAKKMEDHIEYDGAFYE